MEGIPNFENREAVIDGLIEDLAKREEMTVDDISSDIITFAPYEGNEDPNPEYMEQMAEMLGITVEEMNTYAVKKAKEMLEETE